MPDLDLPRLHRFLVEHGKVWAREFGEGFEVCIGCDGTWTDTMVHHLPDCEWVALVEMTRGE